MDNQVKMPKFERGNFSPETEEGLESSELERVRPEQKEQKVEELLSEPLVAKFEIKPEIKDDGVKDEDNNGVDDADDELIAQAFKGSKAEEGGTSSKVEGLISKTDNAILHKERDPHKFLNYWRRMKEVALEEWFDRKIGEGAQKGSRAETAVGEGQESDRTLEILQGRRKDEIQQNVVENDQENIPEEQIDVVENVEDKAA